MPELGNRANVMGPQPIAERKPPPAEMLAAAERMLKLLAEGDQSGLEAMAAPNTLGELSQLAQSSRPGMYDKREIIAQARVNSHYYVKARLSGASVEPFLLQVRLGERDGRWLIWEAKNLSGRRSAWTK